MMWLEAIALFYLVSVAIVVELLHRAFQDGPDLDL
jgi:hypothetical protein